MIFKKKKYIEIVLVIIMCCFACTALGADLTWQTTKQEAINLAAQQDKKILLLAGRDT